MLAAWSLIAPIASMFIAGLAVRGVLARGKALDEAAWIQVPFLGIAVTVLVLQFQLYLDVPVNRGVLALGAIVALLWALWLWRGRVQESLSNLPILPLTVALAVLVVQAAGLASAGPRDYVGRSWPDQVNYVAMAECFRCQGYAVQFEDIGQNPWLGRVPFLKKFRIGQSVLHAFHGVITRMETRDQFMPTILLSCPLIALALFAGARGLGLERRHAALAGFLGGLVPGVTILVQESFLSHALGISFLLLLPVLLSAYNAERSPEALGTAVLCIGGLASIYTEFLILALLMVVGFFVLALAQQPRSLRHGLGFGVLLAAPWLCNPLYSHMTGFLTSKKLVAPGLLAHIYPWGYDRVGLGVIWLGDYCLEQEAGMLHPWATWLGLVVAACGGAGLCLLAAMGMKRWWHGNRQTPANGFDLGLALLGLALMPAVMILHDRDHVYQFYKLLVTVSPLYALGLVGLTVLHGRLWSQRRPAVRHVATAFLWLPVLAVMGVAAWSSGWMVLRSAESDGGPRSSQQIATSPDFQSLRRQLEQMQGQAIVFRPTSLNLGYHQLWVPYFARRNQVWLTFPRINDTIDVEAVAPLAHLTDLSQLPAKYLVLSPRDSAFLLPPKTLPAVDVLWESGDYVLWQYDGRPWGCITHVDNPNGVESRDPRNLWLGGGKSVFRFFATEAGVSRLTVGIMHGPCLDPSEKIRLLIEDDRGRQYPLDVADGPLVLPVALERGRSTLTIQVLNAKQRSAGDDPRPLLVGIRLQDFEFEPAGAATAVPSGPVGN